MIELGRNEMISASKIHKLDYVHWTLSSWTSFFKNCPTERNRGEKNCPTERNRDEKIVSRGGGVWRLYQLLFGAKKNCPVQFQIVL